MKKARVYFIKNEKLKFVEFNFLKIDYKETYIVIYTKDKTHIIKNFENIVCDVDDFWDL